MKRRLIKWAIARVRSLHRRAEDWEWRLECHLPPEEPTEPLSEAAKLARDEAARLGPAIYELLITEGWDFAKKL